MVSQTSYRLFTKKANLSNLKLLWVFVWLLPSRWIIFPPSHCINSDYKCSVSGAMDQCLNLSSKSLGTWVLQIIRNMGGAFMPGWMQWKLVLNAIWHPFKQGCHAGKKMQGVSPCSASLVAMLASLTEMNQSRSKQILPRCFVGDRIHTKAMLSNVCCFCIIQLAFKLIAF